MARLVENAHGVAMCNWAPGTDALRGENGLSIASGHLGNLIAHNSAESAKKARACRL